MEPEATAVLQAVKVLPSEICRHTLRIGVGFRWMIFPLST
jgi:hypothetical protein